MTVTEKLTILENVLDIKLGTIYEDTELDDINGWDSIAVITLIAMFDSVFGIDLTTKEVKEFKTVGDILDKMERGI